MIMWPPGRGPVLPLRRIRHHRLPTPEHGLFVPSLTSARRWLRAVLCYEPHARRWVIYEPGDAHQRLHEGPQNQHLDRTDLERALRWARGYLDDVAALPEHHGTPQSPESGPAWVTEWWPIELVATRCWTPGYSDTPRCALPLPAGHDSTGAHCPCPPTGCPS
ncbi:hypothetical protein ACFY36_51180 [Actinoplanes sp. NPDC000266]